MSVRIRAEDVKTFFLDLWQVIRFFRIVLDSFTKGIEENKGLGNRKFPSLRNKKRKNLVVTTLTESFFFFFNLSFSFKWRVLPGTIKHKSKN